MAARRQTLDVLLLVAKLALSLFGLASSGSRTLIFAGVVFLFVGIALIQQDKNGEASDA